MTGSASLLTTTFPNNPFRSRTPGEDWTAVVGTSGHTVVGGDGDGGTSETATATFSDRSMVDKVVGRGEGGV